MRSLSIFLFGVLSIMHVSGQTGTIEGVVINNSAPARQAVIKVQGTTLGVISDLDGNFQLNGLTAGTYQLQVSHGFLQHSENATVLPGQVTQLQIVLEEGLLDLEQVVVTASRRAQNRREATVIVNVTDSKILEATQSLSLAEGLSFQPGLRLETNCQNCGFSQVRINGMDGAYSQILIDGRPIFSALNGIYGLEQIPANMIDRIEVVRGGGSALYGANAIAGTINVITRDPMEDHYQVSLTGGLINGRNPDASLSLNTTQVSEDFKQGISIFGMVRSRSPYDHNGDGFTEMPLLESQTLGMKSFYKPSLTRRYTVEFHSTREYRRGGDQLPRPPHEASIAEELRSQVVGGGITFEQFSQELDQNISAYVSGQYSDMNNYYGGGQDLNGYGLTEDRNIVGGIQYNRIFDSDRPFVFTLGTEYKWNRMRDAKPGYGLFVAQDLQIFSVYGQGDLQLLPSWKLVAGLRLDQNNLREGPILNPRLSSLIDLGKHWQFRSSYARGFRAPQVFTEDIHVELVAGSIQAIRLGPDLRSELSNSFTVSLDWNGKWGQIPSNLSLEGFFTRLTNPFVLVELPVESSDIPILQKQNGTGATVSGLHLEHKLALGQQWQWSSSVTLQQSRYDEALQWSNERAEMLASHEFLRSPNLYGQFVLRWQANAHWFVAFSSLYTGAMLVPHFAGYIAQDKLVRTADFWELNLKISYTLHPWEGIHLRLQTGVQNVLNQYQLDFDRGADRDAGYIYGPSRPRTIFWGISLEKAHE